MACSGPCLGKWCKDNSLLIATILAVFFGLIAGFLMRLADLNELEIAYWKFLAELLLSMLKGIILPLIMFSMIAGVAGLQAETTGKMGGITIAYYMTTTVIAVFLGIILVCSIKPGNLAQGNDIDRVPTDDDPTTALDTILDLIRNMFPENLVEMCFQRVRTYRVENVRNVTDENGDPIPVDPNNATAGWVEETYLTLEKGYGAGYNVLGMIVVSVAFGIALVLTRSQIGSGLTDWFKGMSVITMKVVWWIIWYSPIGIFFLVSGEILSMVDVAESFSQLAAYMATVMLGLAIHFFGVLPLLYWALTRKNPFTFLYGVIQALLTAFGTASSSATLPITIANLEVNNNISSHVTSFVLPIGATINMDGTALYEAVAAIFIAQYNDLTLSFGEVIVVAITATVAAIGAAGMPSGGLVTLMMVVNAIGLPEEDIGLILSVDWLLDRFRTVTNVWGDSIGCGIVNEYAAKRKWFSETESYEEDFERDSVLAGNKGEDYTGGRVAEVSEDVTPDDGGTDPLEPITVV
eukprot:GHVN01080047.1.p1 GENE.GHVN01080047.1~~GHVN01080047.1.p1  ORF type:complete len:522 (+),score=60.26 GHVN01080047.1:98-1663(+)